MSWDVICYIALFFSKSIYSFIRACCTRLGCAAMIRTPIISGAIPKNKNDNETPDKISKVSQSFLCAAIPKTFLIPIDRPPEPGSSVIRRTSAGIPIIQRKIIITASFIRLPDTSLPFICSQRSASTSCLILSRTVASSPAVYNLTQSRTIEAAKPVMLCLALKGG